MNIKKKTQGSPLNSLLYIRVVYLFMKDEKNHLILYMRREEEVKIIPMKAWREEGDEKRRETKKCTTRANFKKKRVEEKRKEFNKDI